MILLNKYVAYAFSVAVIGLVGSGCVNKSFVVKFDNTKEVSGKKFAVKDINPALPADWTDYNFVVLEFKTTSPQRFHVGFNTDSGYNELRVMSYAANGRVKLAIPLVYYKELPGSAQDMAATYNKKRYTGWVNLGGKRGPMTGIDSIGIRMRAPIGNPIMELYNITLAVEDPGDEYMEETPLVDEFGQWNLGTYEGKANSLEQLEREWRAEEEEVVTTKPYNYSKYGGYLNDKLEEGTGFFRTKLVDGKWWFVDPEGYAFISFGADGVGSGGGLAARDLDKRPNMYKELPPAELWMNPETKEGTPSYGEWNLVRRYGKDDYSQKANEMIIKRMDKWGMNTLANWSSGDVIALNKKPFMMQLSGMGISKAFMGLPDVYDPGFAKMIDDACQRATLKYKDNPYLIGYFSGNEPPWVEHESRLCDMILAADDKTPLKGALKAYLTENGDTEATRKAFIIKSFRTFLDTVNKSLKKHDPNHLNIGIRFGSDAPEEILEACKGMFDVFSFNCYSESIDPAYMDKIMKITGLPMIIGEYHFGTIDRGMAQSLWQVDSQEERGIAYRYYTEQGVSHPGMIGFGYFRWVDQDFTGRNLDGENYGCGLVDVTDRPYKEQVAAMSETAKVAYEVHSGTKAPFNQRAVRPRGHGAIPDVWNE